MCSVDVIDHFLVFLGEGGRLCPSLTLIGDDPPYPCKMKYLTSLLSTVTGWAAKQIKSRRCRRRKTVKILDFFKWEQENMVKFLKGAKRNRNTGTQTPLGDPLQFTVRGFSKCDAAFVHYSLFKSYSLSGLKVSNGAHQYLSNVQKASKTEWNHCLKTTRRYAHRYRRFGNFRMMLNKWRTIVADAVDHVSKASLLKSV